MKWSMENGQWGIVNQQNLFGVPYLELLVTMGHLAQEAIFVVVKRKIDQ